MRDLTNEDVRTLGKAVDLEISDPDLTQVRYSLNALLAGMADIEASGVELQEPLPIIIPPKGQADG